MIGSGRNFGTQGKQLIQTGLASTIVLAQVDQVELDPKRFRSWLDQWLARADNRALFDLPAPLSPKRP